MKNNHLSPELRDLLNVNDDLCVSIIIPLNELPSMKKMDRIVIDHAIEKLQKLLDHKYDSSLVNELIGKLRVAGDELSRITGAKGLGIFISKSLYKVITFPFEVREKINAGSSFEVRDVLYRDQYNTPYFVLSLTLDRVRLFRGSAGNLSEIQDENFPALFSEPESTFAEEELAQTNLAATAKREKVLTMESPHAFLKAVDKKLVPYLGPNENLLLAGVEKEVAAFENTSSLSQKIKGRISGSYNGYNHSNLEKKSWDCICNNLRIEENQLVSSLNELFGKELVSIGLPDVWRNARLGKGNVLVVEKNLMQPAFVTKDRYQIWLSPPADEHELLSDAVDDLIETVLLMDGRVQFVEDGKLGEFQGVAMIHRY